MLTVDDIIRMTRQTTAYGEVGHSMARGTISLVEAGVRLPTRPETGKATEKLERQKLNS